MHTGFWDRIHTAASSMWKPFLNPKDSGKTKIAILSLSFPFYLRIRLPGGPKVSCGNMHRSHVNLLSVIRDIKSQTREEVAAQFKDWGEPTYRVDQVLEWLYQRRAANWDVMTNLPKPLRTRLREHCTLQTLELVRKQGSRDTTQKFLWRLTDHS